MADAVTSRIIKDADDCVIMRFTNISDGSGETAALKMDASTFDASGVNGAACSELAISEIEYSISGMTVQVLFDATTDVVAALLGGIGGAVYGKIDFEKYNRNGLTNNAGAGKTGDILFTTLGHTANDTYDITIKAKKIYAS